MRPRPAVTMSSVPVHAARAGHQAACAKGTMPTARCCGRGHGLPHRRCCGRRVDSLGGRLRGARRTRSGSRVGEPIRCGRSLAVARHEPSPPGLGTRNSCAPAAGVQPRRHAPRMTSPGAATDRVHAARGGRRGRVVQGSSSVGASGPRSSRRSHSCSRSMASKSTFSWNVVSRRSGPALFKVGEHRLGAGSSNRSFPRSDRVLRARRRRTRASTTRRRSRFITLIASGVRGAISSATSAQWPADRRSGESPAPAPAPRCR